MLHVEGYDTGDGESDLLPLFLIFAYQFLLRVIFGMVRVIVGGVLTQVNSPENYGSIIKEDQRKNDDLIHEKETDGFTLDLYPSFAYAFMKFEVQILEAGTIVIFRIHLRPTGTFDVSIKVFKDLVDVVVYGASSLFQS